MEKIQYQKIIDHLIYGNEIDSAPEIAFTTSLQEYAKSFPGIIPKERCSQFFHLVSRITTLEELTAHWPKLVIAQYREKIGVKPEHCPPLYLKQHEAQLRFAFAV